MSAYIESMKLYMPALGINFLCIVFFSLQMAKKSFILVPNLVFSVQPKLQLGVNFS